MSTYTVRIAEFSELQIGDRVIHQGIPVTITAIGRDRYLGIESAAFQDDHGRIGSIPAWMCPPLCVIVPDALEAEQ